MSAEKAFAELVEIMERLRGPDGCPWDREQDHQSIKPYLIEEAHEVAEAIDEGDFDEVRSELGDLLLQVVFHAQMAREAGNFDIEAVVRSINEKMTRRHPHVFSDASAEDADEVLRNWARIKAEERKRKGDNSIVAGVPKSLPALLRAHRLGEKASHVGFDWSEGRAVLDKIDEEATELRQAVQGGDGAEIEHELGDLLMALTSLGRHYKVHAEDALQRANDRFIQRFRYIEEKLAERGVSPSDASAETLEQLWEAAKVAENPSTRVGPG